jgi:hypothetical protein
MGCCVHRNCLWILAGFVLLAAACGSDAVPESPTPFIPPPKDDGPADPPGDLVDAGTHDTAVVPQDPSVTLVGVEGLVGIADDLFCARDIVVIVDAPSIDWEKYALRLLIRAEGVAEDRLLDALEPAPDPAIANRYLFTFDGSSLLLAAGAEPTDGSDPEDPANIQLVPDGGDFTLVAAAMKIKFTGDLTMPSDLNLISEHNYTFDASPPSLTVITPDPKFLPPTLTGDALVEGIVSDSLAAGWVEVDFNGELLATLQPHPEETTSQYFKSTIDLRLVQTSFADLSIRAYDRCGLSDPSTSQWTAQAKVVSWPFLRTAEKRAIEGNPQIKSTVMADWDGDGFLDMILATQKGLMVLHNRDPGDTEDKVRFERLTILTEDATEVVHVLDLENDGDPDIVAVTRLASGERGLVVYRTQADGTVQVTEEHTLPIHESTEIRTMVVADFTNDPEDAKRADIALATDAQEDSLLLFKRHVPDVPQDFDDDACEEVEGPPPGTDIGAPAAAEVADGADVVMDTVIELPEGVPTYHYVCPTLFSDPIKSGGVANIVSLVAADVTGDEGLPDGLPDILVGTDDSNQIRVFGNRYLQEGKLDTAFGEAVVSYIYPGSTTLEHSGHFCMGNFIDIPGLEGTDDPLDIVVAPGYETWRVLRGMGNGTYRNYRPPEDVGTDPYEIYDMSGTSNPDVTGMACADFNGDGAVDFAILSASGRLVQVHLGNGSGRFNQLEASPLLNPLNEGIGFVVGTGAQNLHAVDLNNDGYPDLTLDYGAQGVGVILNLSTDKIFDMHATRALLSPLGKESISDSLEHIAVGDLTGDGAAEIVAITRTAASSPDGWLAYYHRLGGQYRCWWNTDPFGENINYLGFKTKLSPTVMVWGSQEGVLDGAMPTHPAAYDRLPLDLYASAISFGHVKAEALMIADVASPSSSGGDGYGDLVMTGGTASTPQNNVAVFINIAPKADFWDVPSLTNISDAMFKPYNGREFLGDSFRDFALMNPFNDIVPGLAVSTNATKNQACAVNDKPDLPPMLRYCPWNSFKQEAGTGDTVETFAFWDCWDPSFDDAFITCDEAVNMKIGGDVTSMAVLDSTGDLPGAPVDDPSSFGDLVVMNSATGSMSYAEYNGIDPDFPFETPMDTSIGVSPKHMAAGDIDGDGLVDIAAVVDKNVVIAFGQNGFIPWEAPLPVDRDPSVLQTGGVTQIALTDVNNDGLIDVLFTESGASKLTAYLAIGVDQNDHFTREFHGPVQIDMCSGPSELRVYDFDGDTCEDLIVLCQSAGAVAIVANGTCAAQAAAGVGDP